MAHQNAQVSYHESGENTLLPAMEEGVSVTDLPDDVQAALDDLIAFYSENNLRPKISLKGDALTVCSSLVQKVKADLPEQLDDQARLFLDPMIEQIVGYCRHHNTTKLSFAFSFDDETEPTATPKD